MPERKTDTYVTITSPQGVGAIGIVEIIGQKAVGMIKNIFETKTSLLPFHLCYGRIKYGALLDDAMVRFIPAQNSFCGEDTIEIFCHGGSAVIEKIVQLITQFGAIRVNFQEVISIACQNKKIDQIQAEVLFYLPQALTELAVKVLLDQYNGALSETIQKIKTPQDIDNLLATATTGISLVHPKKIVITGKPNAGKSTLFNYLIGTERVLVSPLAGTTRDPVREIIAIEDVPLYLTDTAGHGLADDMISKLAIQIAEEQLQEADLVIFLFDATTSVEYKEMELFQKSKLIKPTIACVNKIDILQSNLSLYEGFLRISALKGYGIGELKKRILSDLGISPHYTPGAPVIFTQRQKDLVSNLYSKL